MPKQNINYGYVVVDGKLRYLSPSGIERGDPNSHNGGGCERSFALRYVHRWKSDKISAPAALGDACHQEMYAYLTTGANVLGRITSAARRYAPMPKSLGVEIELPLGGLNPDLSEAMLEIEGIPIVMYLDVVDRRGQYLNEHADGFYTDPIYTIEYLDWKFGAAKLGSDKCYAKKGPQLAFDTQMTLGGLALLEKFGASHARLSHIYTNTQGTPCASKASVLMDREQLERRTDYIAAVVRSLKHIVRETDIERVPGNPNACNSYGGCPWRESCSVWKQGAGLMAFYGRSEIEALNNTLGDDGMTSPLLAGIQLPGMGNPPVTATAAGVTAQLGLNPAAAAAPVASAHDVLAQMSNIANPQQPAFTPAFPSPEFNAATMMIEQRGYGLFAMTGRAAQMYLAFRGDRRPITAESKVDGYGRLGASGQVVEDPAIVIAAAREMAAVQMANPPDMRPDGQLFFNPPQQQAPANLPILSPSAPASNPQLAADPVPGFTPPNASAVTPNVQIPGLIASVPQATAAAVLAQNATPAAPTAGLPPAGNPPTEGKPKRKYTRRGKESADSTPEESPTGDASWLFVNCRSNITLIDLQPWIDSLCDALSRAHKLSPPDVRSAGGEHPLAFGRWKGFVTATARYEASKLPPGGYYINTRVGEINQCVLEGLRVAKRLELNPDGSIKSEGEMIFELINTGE